MPNEMATGDLSSPNAWGKLISSTKGGGASTYMRDFGDGNLVVTFVIWVVE
jgi:hypothetical protein